MADDVTKDQAGENLEKLHRHAETLVSSYRYARPGAEIFTKGVVRLVKGELIRSQVQIVKKKGGENNLHYHTHLETFWWVIKGRVRFYGPENVLLGEFGPHEGIITPRYSRYWFENPGEEDLEMLQIAASDGPGHISGHVDAAPRHAHQGKTLHFGAPPTTVDR